jgi:hypothetical protein
MSNDTLTCEHDNKLNIVIGAYTFEMCYECLHYLLPRLWMAVNEWERVLTDDRG